MKKRKKRNKIWKWFLGISLFLLAIEMITYVVMPKSNTSKEIVKTMDSTTVTSTVSPTVTPITTASPTLEPKDTNTAESADAQEISEDVKDTLTDEKSEDARVDQILSQMDLQEKVYQMFIVFADSLTGVNNTVSAGNITKSALEKYPVGGLLYQQGNLLNEQQVTKMIAGVQSYSEIPLFIASDEEGGRVARVMKALHPYSLDAMLTYKDMGEDKAYENAVIISDAIEKYGFNMDFAPVADVWSNTENTVISDRAYSDDFEQAAKLVAAAVKGFEDENIICSLKHFPGHGDTETDSHYGAAYVEKTIDELRKEEFLSFKAGIASGADMVMIGHLIVTDIDDLPATFSHKIITDILRDELDFKGIIITDALNMQAMTDYYGSSYIVINAVKAGADILLCPSNLELSVEALTNAVNQGDISEERINESVKRIIKLKLKKGIIK